MNVLIAEDDAMTRLMLQRAVEHHGHVCLVAQDEPPDRVLLDLMLPVLDGWEVLCQPKRDALTVGATRARARIAFPAGIHAGVPCEVLLWG